LVAPVFVVPAVDLSWLDLLLSMFVAVLAAAWASLPSGRLLDVRPAPVVALAALLFAAVFVLLAPR